MVADLFEFHGWRSYFLGANTPQRDLLDLIQEKKPDAVALSLTVYFNLDHLIQVTMAIQPEYPKIPILVGGQAFQWGGREQIEKVVDIHYLETLTDLETWMKSPTAHER